MNKSILIVVILAIVLAVLTFGLSGQFSSLFDQFNKTKTPELVTLNYWSLNDDQSVVQPLIDDYEKNNPYVKITFTKQSILNYRTRLQTQLRNGQGPDIFDIHNSWLPMFSPDLTPDNIDISSYYPIVKDSLSNKNGLIAMPFEMDGVVMFVNSDILKAANVTIPTTWPDFMLASEKMTVKDSTGQIQTAGAALGSSNNIDYWPETIGLLFLQQPAADLTQPASDSGAEVFQFYTNFITDPKNKTWDVNLPEDFKMFTSGKLAFYFAPSRDAIKISQANPALNFTAAPMPQLPTETPVSWASFWVKGVSAYSKHSVEAWKFLEYLNQDSNLQKLNDNRKAAGAMALAYPKPAMADSQKNDPILGAVVSQASNFKSWYLNSDTGDSGINDEMIKVYKDVLDGDLAGQDIKDLLSQAQSGVYQVFIKYGLVKPLPTK